MAKQQEAPKEPTHVLKHKKRYAMNDEGKMVKLKVGTPLALTKDQAKKLGPSVEPYKEIPMLDLASGGKGDEGETKQ